MTQRAKCVNLCYTAGNLIISTPYFIGVFGFRDDHCVFSIFRQFPQLTISSPWQKKQKQLQM